MSSSFLVQDLFSPLFKPDLYVIQQEVEFHKPQSYWFDCNHTDMTVAYVVDWTMNLR